MIEESIYNLIPKEYVPPAKERRYNSNYPKKIAPTGSTFLTNTTSIPKISNLNGDLVPPPGPHKHKNNAATMGKTKEQVIPNAKEFALKGSGKILLAAGQTIPQKEVKDKVKPNIPKHTEKPIMGLKSNKNFIVANAVENILSIAKVPKEVENYLAKPEFGKVPAYLNKIKEEMNDQLEKIKNMQFQDIEEHNKQTFQLSEEEIKNLKEGLKKKWEAVNREYQQITHIRKIDTLGLRRKLHSFTYLRKENCEKELAQIEKDLEKLNKHIIYVDTSA